MSASDALLGARHAARAAATPAAPIRVVLNGRFLSQVRTGVQRYARETVLALDELLEQDPLLRAQLTCELVTPRHAAPLALRRVRVHELPWLSGHAWEQITLAWHARGGYLVNFGYSGPLAKRRQLITLHDASVRAVARAYSWRYRMVHDFLVRSLRHRVDTVMTVSEFSRGEIARRYGVRGAVLGTEGWQHSVAEGDGFETLRKYGLRPQGYLLAVGSQKPHKNFAILDRALAVLGEFPLPLAIAGAQDLSIFRHARRARFCARLLGYVSDADLGHLYRHAAWFVFPSTYEGFGLPPLEAMANGCPVLAARAASIPEVCGDAALYFDPHDPQSLAALMRRTLREPGLRVTFAEKARAHIERFSWAANARIIAGRLLASAG